MMTGDTPTSSFILLSVSAKTLATPGRCWKTRGSKEVLSATFQRSGPLSSSCILDAVIAITARRSQTAHCTFVPLKPMVVQDHSARVRVMNCPKVHLVGCNSRGVTLVVKKAVTPKTTSLPSVRPSATSHTQQDQRTVSRGSQRNANRKHKTLELRSYAGPHSGLM